jgi:hypothetical protein
MMSSAALILSGTLSWEFGLSFFSFDASVAQNIFVQNRRVQRHLYYPG